MRIRKRAFQVAACLVGAFALSLVASPKLRAQAGRITLQSLQDQVNSILTSLASLQNRTATLEVQSAAIQSGQTPVGRSTAAAGNLQANYGQGAETDITGRSVNFTKAQAGTKIVITYSDSFFVGNSSAAGYTYVVSIQVDGVTVSERIIQDVWSNQYPTVANFEQSLQLDTVTQGGGHNVKARIRVVSPSLVIAGFTGGGVGPKFLLRVQEVP